MMTKDEAATIILAALRAAPNHRLPMPQAMATITEWDKRWVRAAIARMEQRGAVVVWGKYSEHSWVGLPGAPSPIVEMQDKLRDGIAAAGRPVSMLEVCKMMSIGIETATRLLAPLLAEGKVIERTHKVGLKVFREYHVPGVVMERDKINRLKFTNKSLVTGVQRPTVAVKCGPQETRMRTTWKRIEQGEHVDQIDLVTAVADAQWLAKCVDVHASARRLAEMVEAEAKGKLGWR